MIVQTVLSNSNPSIGSRFTLSCQAVITANHHALTFRPILSVQYNNGSTVQTGFGITVTGPRQLTSTVKETQIVFDHLQTSHADLYQCSALLRSPALDSPLFKENHIQLILKCKSLRVMYSENVVFAATGNVFPLFESCVVTVCLLSILKVDVN